MRRERAPIDSGEQLLRELVESVPVSTTAILRPVALRSVALQRRQALAGYAVRTWLDTALVHAEWLIGLAVVLAIGGIALRGPIDSRLHPPPQPAARRVAAQPLRSTAQSPPAATDQPLRRARVEPAVAEWELQRSRDAVPAGHPELGRALPSSTRPNPAEAEPQDVDRWFAGAAPAEPEEAAPAVALDPRPVYLEAPSVGIQADVVEVFLEDGAWQVADYAVGFHHGTGQPGEGNLVMAGHKGIRGAVFASLEALRPGDEVFVDTAGERFRYRVRETRRVWPSEVDVMYPTGMPTLTLLTCTNWDLQRFVVIADLVDSAPRVASTSG